MNIFYHQVLLYARGNFIKTVKISSLANRFSEMFDADIGFVVTEATEGFSNRLLTIRSSTGFI